MKKYPLSDTRIVNEIPELLSKFIKTVQSAGRGKEACALIFGFKESGIFRMTDYCQAENILDSAVSFEVDSDKLANALVRFEDEMSKKLVAIFHSHPGQSNTPSSSDLRTMKYWRILWFISKADPCGVDDIRAFILQNNGEIEEINVREILENND